MTSRSTGTDAAFEAAAGRLEETAPALLAQMLRCGGAAADLFLEASLHHRLRREGGGHGRQVRLGEPEEERRVVQGLGARVWRGASVGLAAADGLTPASWPSTVAAAVRALGTGGAVRTVPAPWHLDASSRPPDAPDRAGRQERRALVEAALDAALALDARVVHVVVDYHDRTRYVGVFTSWGRAARGMTMLLGLRVSVTLAGPDGRRATGHALTGGAVGFGHFFEHPPERVAQEAVARARRALEARPVSPGPLPVVLAAGAGGVWLHEAGGHPFEADVGSAARPGDRVAPPGVTLVDDPTRPGGRGTMLRDDEATPATPIVLAEGGRLCTRLTDRRHADPDDPAPPCRARRQDYRHPPLPRMTNLCLLPGTASAGDLIADVRDGLYVDAIAHGVVHPGTGTYRLEGVEGWRIEQGRLTHLVAGLSLEGSLKAGLHALRGIAGDARLDTARGVCEKAGQRVPVSVAMPTVLVEGMTVVSRSRL